MPINYNNYPKDWQEIRLRILKREGHCCKKCGLKNYSVGVRDRTTKKMKVQYIGTDFKDAQLFRNAKKKLYNEHPIIIVITVAHLDQDEWNHEVKDDRLAALCQMCHFQYDYVDNQHRKKYGKQYRRFQIELF